jgi:hypothetical protein
MQETNYEFAIFGARCAGKGWNTLLHLYSPGQAWFDKIWRPGEIELVDYQRTRPMLPFVRTS